MKDLLPQVIEHARGAWRFRWAAVALAWVIAIGAGAVVLLMPDRYEARARVYVDTDSVLKQLMSGLAVGTDVMNEVNMMSTVLLSRPNLDKVARETDLYLRATTPEQMDALLERLSKSIILTGGSQNTYSLTYIDTDRQTAQRVVQTLLDSFVEDTLGIKREDASSAQRFLDEQIHLYEDRLRAAEERLAEFKRKNVGLMPRETGDYYTRLQTELSGIDTLKAKIRQVESRREEQQRQLSGEEPSFGLVGPSEAGPPSAYDIRIGELQAKLDGLLTQYTEKHPEVISLRQNIAELEKEKAAKKPRTMPSTGLDPNKLALRQLDINPVYQSMKIALSQTDTELAELRQQLSEAERRIADLKGRVNTIPDVEAELARLNRDYDVNKQNYTALTQRRESARISEQADQSTDKVKFRIIDPATVPILPVAPNRPLLLTGALLFALGAGIAAAVLLDQLWPAFCSRRRLQEAVGLPVLGTITAMKYLGTVAWYRRAEFRFGAAVVALVICYGAVLFKLVLRPLGVA